MRELEEVKGVKDGVELAEKFRCEKNEQWKSRKRRATEVGEGRRWLLEVPEVGSGVEIEILEKR